MSDDDLWSHAAAFRSHSQTHWKEKEEEGEQEEENVDKEENEKVEKREDEKL